LERLFYLKERVTYWIKEWFIVSVVACLATAPWWPSTSRWSPSWASWSTWWLFHWSGPGPALGGGRGVCPGIFIAFSSPSAALYRKFPLWLGYQAVQWGARVPGSAIITPTPTWLEIAAYYAVLILVFYPRGTFLTRAGAVLAGLVLLTAAALPLATAPRALEVTAWTPTGGSKGWW